VIIWGNHSSTQYPDVSHAYVVTEKGKVSAREAVNDDAHLHGDFVSTVQQRGAVIIKLRKLSSAASAAKAIIDHMRDWIFGTPEGEIISMAVYSDGSYGIQKDLIFSFPVTTKDGKYTIVQGLTVDEFSRSKLKLTEEELVGERNLSAEFL